MYTVASLIENLDVEQVKSAAQAIWVIPAGVVALYFYGVAHFNTPDYRLVILQSPDSTALLTLAPPKYTTTKARFRRYARWYVFILECAFLAFVFFTSIFSNATHLLFALSIEEAGSLQSKAIFALFFLTGLLSSFPGFKDLDVWILTKLHQAALIPDDAKLMASRLFDAEYKPSKKIRDQVRQTLKSRDTIRYSDGKLSGTLEQRVLSLYWLHAQLTEKTKENDCAYFASKFEIDLTDIGKSFNRLRADVPSYFKEQEKLVPAAEADIDQYLSEQIDNEKLAFLASQRKELFERCDSLYYRMCLLTSLLAYSIEDTAEEIDDFLRNKLGFGVSVQSNAIMDWDAVFRVVSSVFVLMLAANALFMGIIYLVGGPGNMPLDRSRLLIFALSTTLLYFIVIYAALKIKRRWRRGNRPENHFIAIICYFLTLPVSAAISYYARGELSIAPLLFATNQAIVGYFVATYIDRSLADKPFSLLLAGTQAAVQFIAALLVFFFLPRPGGIDFTPLQQIVFATFFACQAGLAGFLVGGLFQYFYRHTNAPQGQIVGDITVQIQPAT